MIRVAVSEDISGIMELMLALRKESPVFADMKPEYHYVADRIIEFINFPDGIVLVDEHEGEIVGTMFGVVSSQWYSSERVAYEGVLYVRSDLRKGNIAKSLICRFEEEAYQRKAVGVLTGATVGIADEKVGRLYQYLGYKNERGGWWKKF